MNKKEKLSELENSSNIEVIKIPFYSGFSFSGYAHCTNPNTDKKCITSLKGLTGSSHH